MCDRNYSDEFKKFVMDYFVSGDGTDESPYELTSHGEVALSFLAVSLALRLAKDCVKLIGKEQKK